MKKILSLLLMLTCVLGLTACGGEVEKLQYDEKEILAQCNVMYGYIAMEDENGNTFADISKNNKRYLNLNEDGLDILAEDVYDNSADLIKDELNIDYVGIRTEGVVIINAIDSWQNALEDVGTPGKPDFKNADFDLKDKELIVTVPFKGTEHDGSIQYIFDKNLHMTSVTTNVDLSLGESMKKAGVNTAIGMGTVFCMLVVIMIIIYCFGIIPKLQNAGKAKKENKADTAASVDKAIEAIVEREESTDDTELVAVIAAAIAQYEGTSTDGFVVRSIRRIK